MREQLRNYINKESALLVVLLIMAVACWGFVELQDEVREGEAIPFDEQILLAFRDPGSPDHLRGPKWLELVARDITALGGVAVLTLLTLSAAIFFLLRRQWLPLALTLVLSIGGTLLVNALKELYERERPGVVRHLMEESSHSFPSGHSTMAAVIYLTLAVMLSEFQGSRRMRIYILILGALLTVLVGISRIMMGVHYPSDVAAGWTIGILWACALWIVAHKLRLGHPEPGREP